MHMNTHILHDVCVQTVAVCCIVCGLIIVCRTMHHVVCVLSVMLCIIWSD